MNEPLLITANLLKDIKKCSAKVNYSLTYNGISIQQQLNPSTFYSPLLRRSALMQKINSAVVFGSQINSGGLTQVNSDWNATSGVAEILNKPTIPSDISQLTDNTGAIPTATSDLTNDSNFVADASYVHTDNNYTTTDKQTLADNKTLIDIKTDSSKGIYFYDNFLYAKTATATAQIGLSYYILNSAARSAISVIETGYGKKRALDLNTYTNAAGDSGVFGLVSSLPNMGAVTYEARVKIPVLSAAAQRFACYSGLQGGFAAPTDYIRFEYSDNLNSGKFLCSCCVGGVATTVDSGITVNADTWYILKIVGNSDATSFAFYIDTILVATITTNIPAAIDLHCFSQIIKSVGVTQRDYYVDFYKFYQKYN